MSEEKIIKHIIEEIQNSYPFTKVEVRENEVMYKIWELRVRWYYLDEERAYKTIIIMGENVTSNYEDYINDLVSRIIYDIFMECRKQKEERKKEND